MKTELVIPVIEGQVHLGCLPEERTQTQAVRTEIKIRFKKIPPAFASDSLKNNPCYKEMAEILDQVFEKKHYATIEHLAAESFKKIRKYLKGFSSTKGSELFININKVQPPVSSIKQGSHFSVTSKI